MRTFKNTNMEFETTFRDGNKEITIRLKADLDIGADTTFHAIAKFTDDVRELMKEYQHCLKEGNFCKVSLSQSILTYDGERFTSTGYNRWEYCGYPTEDGGETGIYLKADTRYTEAEWDMFLEFSDNVLEELAKASL